MESFVGQFLVSAGTGQKKQDKQFSVCAMYHNGGTLRWWHQLEMPFNSSVSCQFLETHISYLEIFIFGENGNLACKHSRQSCACS